LSCRLVASKLAQRKWGLRLTAGYLDRGKGVGRASWRTEIEGLGVVASNFNNKKPTRFEYLLVSMMQQTYSA
jgi:hypothetical protein